MGINYISYDSRIAELRKDLSKGKELTKGLKKAVCKAAESACKFFSYGKNRTYVMVPTNNEDGNSGYHVALVIPACDHDGAMLERICGVWNIDGKWIVSK